MALFSAEQSFLGIDLGAGNIKMVELRNEQGRPRLVTYSLYEVPHAQVIDNDWSKRRGEAVAVLRELLAKSKAQSRLVVSALPTFAVFSSLISIPPVSPKELPEAIRLEAKKVVPRPIEEMILDWKEIKSDDASAAGKSAEGGDDDSGLGRITNTKNGQQRKILLTAAPKELVDGYVSIFREANLRLVSLETEALALSRSLIGRDQSVLMVVDMGAKSTNLSIIEQGIPLVNRGVNFGGALVTQAISKRMGVSIAAAEQWKRDTGLTGNRREISPAVKGILDDVLHEIEYLFQLYRRQFSPAASNKPASIEKIVLAGGSCFVPGLPAFLAERLNVPVHIGDPWARIVYPEDLTPVLGQLGPSMAVSVGLAMRHIAMK
ncbi:MAG: pilus assembly protein PilM [Parcubacteria group bacterium]|nr:pilus assembly protein PilM [Parcubacteria group bacterium]